MPKLTGFSRVPIPGPGPFPLLGRLPQVGHIPRVFQFFDDPIATLDDLRQYGDVAAVAGGSPAFVCVFGADRNREVLTNPSGFRHDEDFINGGEGTPLARMSRVLVSINGEEHKRHRRLMMPAFARSALDGYADDIVRVSEGMIDRWPIGQVADLDVLLRDLALCMAVRSLFGLDMLTGATEMGEVAVELVETLTTPLSILLPYDLPGLPFHRAQQLGGQLLAQLEQLIARKRKADQADERDALALLIHAVDDEGGRLTDAELVAETVTLFVAGHETTAKTLTWTMFLLERHPDVLADLLDEIDGVLGGRSMTAADIPAMPLLDRVIKESMRVLTPVPTLFFRVPSANLPLGRFMLPKGANVIVSPYATHHDPELYAQPKRFLPDRWETIKPTPFEYLPFGAGPRICVGAAFAQQALRLILPTLLQRVRVQVVRDARIARLTRANILMPRYGVKAHLHAPHRDRLVVEPIRGDIHELVELR